MSAATIRSGGRAMPSVSETVSENGKVGRPPAYPSELMASARGAGLFGDVQTRRAELDIMYRIEATRLATDAEREAMKAGAGWPLPPTVLTELGRLLRDGLSTGQARFMWDALAMAKPPARAACRILRDYRRSGAEPAGRIIVFLAMVERVARAELAEDWAVALFDKRVVP